jgi:hypothetical protein
MYYWHILYIDARPVAEIEIRVEPFLTWADELALKLSVTDLDGAEHGIQCPELLSLILARHRDELWDMALEKHREFVQSCNQRRPVAAFIISGDPS